MLFVILWNENLESHLCLSIRSKWSNGLVWERMNYIISHKVNLYSRPACDNQSGLCTPTNVHATVVWWNLLSLQNSSKTWSLNAPIIFNYTPCNYAYHTTHPPSQVNPKLEKILKLKKRASIECISHGYFNKISLLGLKSFHSLCNYLHKGIRGSAKSIKLRTKALIDIGAQKRTFL